MATLSQYKDLLEDRPTKLEPEEVDYRAGEDLRRCGKCLHFFERKLDSYGVCEVVRPENDEPIEADYVCKFFTIDGFSFPLYPGSR